MKYFNNIKSYKDLKEKYKILLKENHPDNGGDLEKMKEINVEYDVLFSIWKDKDVSKLTEEEKKETASSTKRYFYTQYGWEGSNYDAKLSLKEIAQIIRRYIKEKYPTCKFSVRTKYASMCQSLQISLLEFPDKMYKTGDDLRAQMPLNYDSEEIDTTFYRMLKNGYFKLDAWVDEDFIREYEKAYEISPFYRIKTEYFKSVIEDVEAFVRSYNYDDSDSMIDYFDVNFYGGDVDYSECVQVNRTARIKKANTTPAAKEDNKESGTAAIDTSGKAYTITESEHTKTHEKIFLVKWIETLSKQDYIELNKKIKSIGGYYSKFTHSFVFKEDPTEKLDKINIA